MTRKLINFDVDDVTEKHLEDIATATGIQNNASTIRYLINSAWQQMFNPLGNGIQIPETPLVENDHE